jgi:hypothetical protein
MTKQIAARRTAKHWQVLVDQQVDSGQSVMDPKSWTITG